MWRQQRALWLVGCVGVRRETLEKKKSTLTKEKSLNIMQLNSAADVKARSDWSG